MLLQTLSQSFMENPAAAHGLSAALAPPASTAGGTATSTRNGAVGAAGGAAAGSGSARDNASQHTISVSLGKAWLEILVKLMRRASEGGIAVAAAGGDVGESDVVADALEDPSTRDALLVLFERTAAGVAAAAAAATATVATATAGTGTGTGTNGGTFAAVSSFAGSGSGAASAEERKAPVWADPALVLRSLVLLREVLVRVPDAYVVPLRRRGVLHRFVFHSQFITRRRASVTPPPPRSLC